ncbi:MAG: hypothetical protein ACK4FF_06300 [Limnobacter sp.]|uniref:hypothetical protein n=1 Tax=Limnobacter sp. TaxID=2003368 RepID=UPI00391D06E7
MSLFRNLMSISVLALLLILSGCAGFRGGWTSLAYVGDTPPQFDEVPTSGWVMMRSELKLPGLKLGVSINNQLRTYDNQVYFFVLPLVIDPRNVYQLEGKEGVTRVSLRIVPTHPGYIFEPQRARLSVNGKTVQSTAAYEFGRWDANGEPKLAGTDYSHKPVTQVLSLSELNDKAYQLTLEFPIERVSPEGAAISLDLSDALRNNAQPAIPLIRFHPVRWKEGYT